MTRTKAFNETDALERAMDLFWMKGYHGTSMQDLVDAMGISRSSIYSTFGDKHAIFLAAFQHYKRGQQHSFDFLEESSGFTAALASFFNMLLRDIVSDEEKKGCFIVNSSTEMAWQDNAVKAIIQENYDEFESHFLPFFEKAIGQGEVRDTNDPRAMTRFLYVNMVGLRAVSRATDDITFLRDAAKTALNALIS
jgi:TetR/AcrR family transcriptional repressor of nem operon